MSEIFLGRGVKRNSPARFTDEPAARGRHQMKLDEGAEHFDEIPHADQIRELERYHGKAGVDNQGVPTIKEIHGINENERSKNKRFFTG